MSSKKRKSRKTRRAIRPRVSSLTRRVQASAKRKKNVRRRNLFGLGGGGGNGFLTSDQVRDRQKDAICSASKSGDFRGAGRIARMSAKKFARTRGLNLEGVGRRVRRRIGKAIIPNPRKARKVRRVTVSDRKVAAALVKTLRKMGIKAKLGSK